MFLETVTHLVPGNDRGEKLQFVQNIVCNHIWQRDFDRDQDRMWPRGDKFGLENRNCYFVIDHHGHDHTIEEDITVPVVRYRWTGQFL
mgnify:FL=1